MVRAYIEHTQRLRGCGYVHGDYLTQNALNPLKMRLSAGTRTSRATLTAATAHRKSSEQKVQLKEKLLKKPVVAGWIEDHRMNELRNERKCRRQRSA